MLPRWEETWLDVAQIIAKRSKDPNTQVGCVLVSPDNRQIHTGYNGFASGIEDRVDRWTRPEKYNWVIHAEENAIINSRTNLSGWTCYTTLRPCERCSSKIVQAGIAKVVFSDDNTNSSNYRLAQTILDEGRVLTVRKDANK